MADTKNIVFIGKKSAMVYATTATILSKNHNKIIFIARGNNIQRAVDTSQLTLRKFLIGWSITNIDIKTNELIDGDKQLYISQIEITIEVNTK